MDDEQGIVQDAVEETDQADLGAQDEFAELREHYEAGTLSDEELDTIADTAITYIREILAFFGEEKVTVDEYEGDEGELILDISGGDLAVLIGRHGRTLDALQMIISSLMSNHLHFHYPVVVDVEGYKSRRKEKLETLARNAASRARRQHGSVKLAPMNAFERRIVHLALLDSLDVTTHSEGVDPERRVVVTYVRS